MVYQYKENGEIVSNCHKIPASEFNRFIINSDNIVARYQQLIGELRIKNPQLKIVFTVSPVRHWKDGASGNQLSKANLIIAIHKLTEIENGYYFPAYEIIIDDLRDYRFYEDNLLHPNKIAVDYIYEKFKDAFFSEETNRIKNEIGKLNAAVNHRIFNRNTSEYKKFMQSMANKVKRLSQQYPYINLKRFSSFRNG